MVVAGEMSGDMHAADLVRAARARHPDLRFFGIGGDHLRAAGMEILVDAREMAVLGLWEVLKRYRHLKGVFDAMVKVAAERRPDAVLLVDYPGFNLRFAAALRKLGLRVVYYVCPQVWAWHRSRIGQMAKLIDRLLVIFPFEVDVFAGTGLRVEFVGHPLVDEARAAMSRPPVPLPWPGDIPVALLPGSRRQEIERILPLQCAAAAELERRVPGCGFLVASPSTEVEHLVRARLGQMADKPSRLAVVTGSTREVLRQARAALVKSGTSTLEAALMGCPMIVTYRAATITYHIGKRLVRVPYLGMVNLIAGRELCPEFIQDAAQPGPMAAALVPLLADTPQRAAMLEGLSDVRVKLGGGGAAGRAAEALLEELGLAAR